MRSDDFQRAESLHPGPLPVLHRHRTRHRWQQVLGIAMLLAGYMSLAVPADTPTQWLLVRVAGGFGLLFAGFAVAIVPLVASIFGEHGDA